MPPPSQATSAQSVSNRLGSSVKAAEQVLLAAKSRALRPFGLTVPQYATLLAVHITPDQSAAQLARSAMVAPQTMATIIGNLESKQLIRREPSPLHRRVLVTRITAAGTSLVTEADAAAKAVEEELAGQFTPSEQAQLRQLLQRAIDHLRTKA